MASSLFAEQQDFHHFANAYRERFPDDVLTLAQPLSAERHGRRRVARRARRHEMLVCERVDGLSTPLVTNVFASRPRIGRLFGVDANGLFDAWQQRANAPVAPVVVPHGPCSIR